MSITFGTPSDFNPAGEAKDTSVSAYSASGIFIAYGDKANGNLGRSISAEVTGISIVNFGTAVTFSAGQASRITSDALPGLNEHFAFWSDKNNNKAPQGAAGILTGSNMSWGSEVSPNLSFQVQTTDMCFLSARKFVATYSDKLSKAGETVIGDVSTGSVVTYGSPVQYSTSNTDFGRVANVGSSGFVAVWSDGNDAGHGTARIGSVNGTTISYGLEYEFLSTGTAQGIDVATINDNLFIVVYTDVADSNFGKARLGSVNGNVITFHTESPFQPAGRAVAVTFSRVVVLSATNFVVIFTDASSGDIGIAILGTINGTQITFEDLDVVFFNSQIKALSIDRLDNSRFIMSYEDKLNKKSFALVGQIPAPTPINTSSDLYIAGGAGVPSKFNSHDLLIKGQDVFSESIDLFTISANNINTSKTFYIQGKETIDTSLGSGVQIEIARAIVPSGTGSQDITFPNFGIPQAAMCFLTRSETPGVINGDSTFVLGFLDEDSNTECISNQFTDNADGFVDGRVIMQTDLLKWFIPSTGLGGIVEGKAVFESYIQDGIRINWTSVPPSSGAYVLTVVLMKGQGGFQSKAGSWVQTSGLDNTQNIDVGFKPDLVLAFNDEDFFNQHGESSNIDTNSRLGIATNGPSGVSNQNIEWWHEKFASFVTSTGGARVSTSGLLSDGISSGNPTSIQEIGFIPTGFQITDRLSHITRLYSYLAFKFPSGIKFWNDIIDSPTSTGNASIIAPGFKPGFVFQVLSMLDNISFGVQDNRGSAFGLSAFTDNDQQSIGLSREVDVHPTNTKQIYDDLAIHLIKDQGVDAFVASHTSMDPSGWTLNYSIVDSTVRKWFGFAIESSDEVFGTTLYTAGPQPINQSVALFTTAALASTNNFTDLFISAPKKLTTSGNLFINAIGAVNSSIDLFIGSIDQKSKSTTLYIVGHESKNTIELSGVRTEMVTTTVPSGIGNQDITFPGFGDPSAVICFLVRSNTIGTIVSESTLAFGFIDKDGKTVCQSDQFDDNSAAGVTGGSRVLQTNLLNWLEPDTGATVTIEGRSNFVDYITDGIRINWDTVPSGNGEYILTVILLKGQEGFDSRVGSWNQTGTLGVPQSVDVGFEPSLLIASNILSSSHTSVKNTQSAMAVGFATNKPSGIVQNGLLAFFDHAGSTAFANVALSPFNLYGFDPGSQIIDVNNFTPSGFEVTESQINNRRNNYLALKLPSGTNFWTGMFDSPTVQGNASITAPGFKPGIVFQILSMVDNFTDRQTDVRATAWGFSAFTDIDEQFAGWSRQDVVNPTNTNQIVDNKAIHLIYDSGIDAFIANRVSMDPSGWTLNYSLADPGIRKWLAFAIEAGDQVDGLDLYTLGKGQETTSIDLFIHGSTSVNNSFNLFIDGIDTISASTDLYTDGKAFLSDSVSLFVNGVTDAVQIIISSDLFTHGQDTFQTSGTLYSKGHEGSTASKDLFITSQDAIQVSGDLFAHGKNLVSTDNDLFVNGHTSISDNRSLFINSKDNVSTSINLYTNGHLKINTSGDLYSTGSDIFNSTANLFTSGSSSVSSITNTIDLYSIGSDIISNSLDLFMHGRQNSTNSIDIFINGLDINNSLINIYIQGHNITSVSSDLYIEGIANVSNTSDLFVKGLAIASGVTTPSLFILGNEIVTNSIDLLVGGFNTLNSSTNLYLAGIDSASLSDDLYVAGIDIINTSKDLFLLGFESINSIISPSLFVHGHENSQTSESLFVKGHGLSSTSGNLFIMGPTQTTASVNLFLGSEGGTASHSGNLFISGPKQNNISATLFLNSFGTTQTSVDLFVIGRNSSFISGSLFIQGNDSTTQSGSLYAQGHQLDTGQVDIVIVGSNPVISLSTSGNIFIDGHDTSSVSGNMFVQGNDSVSHSGILYAKGHRSTVSNIDLVIAGNQLANVSTTSGDVFIYGLDSLSSSIDLFISAPASVNAFRNLYEQGHGNANSSHDIYMLSHEQATSSINLIIVGFSIANSSNASKHLFSQGHISVSAPSNLYMLGHEANSGQSIAFIDGKKSISGSLGLFTTTKNEHNISSELYIQGFDNQVNQFTLFVQNLNQISDLKNLFINGFEPISPVVCPALDPFASIQIKNSLIKVYQSRIDASINQLGKNVTLEFDPILTPCPNCTFDTIRRRSTGIHIPGGPRPFKKGRKCPWCKGLGLLETPVTKCIKCLIKWNLQDAEKFGISVDNPKGIVRFKTFLTEADDLIRAKTAISNKDIKNKILTRVRLIQGPIPVGLRERKYCISFWELI